MLVILDRQHGTKAAGSWHPGAADDLDGDGVVETHEQEARLTTGYIGPAVVRLYELGHEVIVLGLGNYSYRHSLANAQAALVRGARVAYVACHLNAGGGSYGLVIYHDAGSHDLAQCLAVPLGAIPALSRVVVADTTRFPRARSTVVGIDAEHIASVCYEPAFLDQIEHRALLSSLGLERIGIALADGLHAWGAA